jgi:glycine C-acetyltransferase
MYGKIQEELKRELEEITRSGLYKTERDITSPQKARIRVVGKEVLNMCANNYLGLANNQEIIQAVKNGLDERGFGMASVRFICGTQDIHHELEKKISAFFGTDDTILYTSCFDANTGLFETLLGEADAIISDALNHASIIDGIRMCKAARHRYAHGDMQSLESYLKEAAGAQIRMMASRSESILSPQPWARPWAAPPVDLPQADSTSSTCSGSGRDLTFSRIHCRRPLFQRR